MPEIQSEPPGSTKAIVTGVFRTCRKLYREEHYGKMKHLFPVLLAASSCAHSDPDSEAAHNRKVMALQEKFDRFDYNADGKLTRAEIEQGLKESDVGGVTEEELDQAMQAYDVDRDGAISRWESQRAINSPLPDNR